MTGFAFMGGCFILGMFIYFGLDKISKSNRQQEDGGRMKDKDVERLKEIIRMSHKLKWTFIGATSYPLMQLSEVEKCMLAMVDDSELNIMRKWELEQSQKETGR
jgi:hypothetical protein